MTDNSTNLAESNFEPPTSGHPISPSHSPLTLKIPASNIMNLRRSTRRASSTADGPSGSEYHASEKSADMDEQPDGEEPVEEPVEEVMITKRGRQTTKKTYVESSDNDAEGDDDQEVAPENLFDEAVNRKVTRASSAKKRQVSDEDDDDNNPGPGRLRKRTGNLKGFVESDEEELLHAGRYETRNRSKRLSKPLPLSQKEKEKQQKEKQQQARAARVSKRNATRAPKDADYEHESSGASADADGSLDEAHPSSDQDDLGLPEEPEREPEPEEDGDGKTYSLRVRKKHISYAIPAPLELDPKQAGKGRSSGGGGKGKPRLGWSATGRELGKALGLAGGDDSDSDRATRTPRKPFGGIAPFGAVAGGGMLPGDLAAGTPSNLGKISDAALADADPLGVNQNVTFDEVGGLDDHIHALKEMTLLPLLYPEVFQRFNVTPPRGVLFHGPPGTGKTLMARALAASCRTGGRQISFFMRKGADCLSKWVGEAERQLRLLFEEARNSQPSIIFFDEIDGLAPVRSSKQDQIHASIVSTLLALMDGMDGRGQVVVIGATNRPDAVDPALRRPGRFDREFYFGLPGMEAREKILSIMTNKWEGWGGDESEKTEEKQTEIKEKVKGLAKLTKGYGGADLRALCTEAALNAIQRRYPQVYKSNERLLLKPETIGVGLRDFMISIKKLVPSSARSSASAATPLPTQLVPLLEDTLENVKMVIQRVMPVEKKLSALEEAEFEDEGGEEGALEKEMLSQAMQTLRVYRPRIIIHGPIGMGQGYIGAAALHHLEGYHVQSLELGSLMSDSTRTPEAAIVQLFIEAKRNQPSVIYIPSLVGWCAAISETARSTVRAMLDTLAPTDPILLLAVVDGSLSELPRDVKAWFGPTKDNRVQLAAPSASQRAAFFDGLLKDVQRPPNKFADGMERRKRVLEELPIAPPPEPRKPTAAELALQEEADSRVLTLLKYRLGPILTELKRKYKRFTKRATEEYNFDPSDNGVMDTVTTTAIDVHRGANGALEITEDQPMPMVNGDQGPPVNGIMMEQQQIIQQPLLYDMDLERMQTVLYKDRYLTPQDFLNDVKKILYNAEVRANEDMERLNKAQMMYTAAEVSIQEFDPQLRQECERMAVRERQRREERRRERDKGREKERGPAPPVGTRRSARNNGLQPEHAITDPVLLERKLKRQRGEEGSGMDSNASEIEAHHGLPLNNGERDAKRSRLVDMDDDRDPLDTLASSRPNSEGRLHNVRFAPTYAQSLGPLFEQPMFQQPDHIFNHNQFNQNQSPLPHFYPHQLPASIHPSLQRPNGYHPYNQMPHDQPTFPEQVNNPPRSNGGFNPALLNPVVPGQDFHASPFAPRPNNNGPFNFSTVLPEMDDPFQSRPNLQHMPAGESFLDLLRGGDTPTPPIDHMHTAVPHDAHLAMQIDPALETRKSKSKSKSKSPMPVPVLAPAPDPIPERIPTPMVVERVPTPMIVVERVPTPAPPPPLPDFKLTESSVADLRYLLRERTESLTVEQLEQLRATCLGTVWRHRREWERDELVRELIKDVNEFIEEVEGYEGEE